MSAEVAFEDLDVDLEDNVVVVSLTTVDELFDEDGELRLFDDGDEWSGYVREDGSYFYVDTTRSDYYRKVRVGERAVQLAVQERIEDPDVGGVGTFLRGAEP